MTPPEAQPGRLAIRRLGQGRPVHRRGGPAPARRHRRGRTRRAAARRRGRVELPDRDREHDESEREHDPDLRQRAVLPGDGRDVFATGLRADGGARTTCSITGWPATAYVPGVPAWISRVNPVVHRAKAAGSARIDRPRRCRRRLIAHADATPIAGHLVGQTPGHRGWPGPADGQVILNLKYGQRPVADVLDELVARSCRASPRTLRLRRQPRRRGRRGRRDGSH